MLPSSFVPTGSRARLATAFLAATIAIDVVAIGSDVGEISAINRYLDGTDFSTGPLVSSDHRQQVVGVLQIAALALTAIVFIRWFHAAYRNLSSLGVSELRFKPGWAIGAWFVPFLSLWRPKQIADDICRASEPEQPDSSPRTPNYLLNSWWAFWLLSLFVGNASGRVLFKANTLTDIRDAAKVDIAAMAFDITAAVLAILVIRHITNRQLDRAQLLAAEA
jgi:hypothetical protein